VDGVEMN
ncbi:hypothetical protein D043_2909B, partial [Vibrio parahaemolyticus EKP-021]